MPAWIPAGRMPAWIPAGEQRRLASSRQHKAKLAAEEERLHDVDVESNIERSLSATPLPSSPLQPAVPRPVPPPRAVRRLPIDDQQATNSSPLRSPSPERAASPVVEEAPALPAAAAAACSQSVVRWQDGGRGGRGRGGRPATEQVTASHAGGRQ